ncbi:MAG: PleD family two-component system response regulator [Beijerinckiaceae bacterium]|jgi:two-component system cell cycle response regulator
MTARILVVDDIPANVRLLEARLSAEYFEVLSASDGPTALSLCAQGLCDVVLMDVMMPGMDGFEACRRLKADPATAHLPVVMVTSLDQNSDRLRGLEAGADDFLGKPVDEMALIARVKSLARLKVSLDELRNRRSVAARMGAAATLSAVLGDTGEQGRILLVDDRASSIERIVGALRSRHRVDVERDPSKAAASACARDYELMIVSLGLSDFDGLRVCGQLRSLEQTRHAPILLVAEQEDRARVLRGLELGANDYVLRPVDRNELVARVRSLVRRRRYAEALRNDMQSSIDLALVDPLTGLGNRRLLDARMPALIDECRRRGRPLSLLALDIDRFKSVNDTFGHEAGDEVLRAFAARLRNMVRESDLACRLGGEEFVVVMPDADLSLATRIAERVRRGVEIEPFAIGQGARRIPVTVSAGLTVADGEADANLLLRRADRALYRSKAEGRNRVSLEAA